MDVCSAHDDAIVCYTTRRCPVCEELDNLTSDVRSLERNYANAKAECDEFEAELAEIQYVIDDFPEIEALVKLRRRS